MNSLTYDPSSSFFSLPEKDFILPESIKKAQKKRTHAALNSTTDLPASTKKTKSCFWSEQQQELLRIGVKQYGIHNWKIIGSTVFKSPEQCKHKWEKLLKENYIDEPLSQNQIEQISKIVKDHQKNSKYKRISWKVIKGKFNSLQEGNKKYPCYVIRGAYELEIRKERDSIFFREFNPVLQPPIESSSSSFSSSSSESELRFAQSVFEDDELDESPSKGQFEQNPSLFLSPDSILYNVIQPLPELPSVIKKIEQEVVEPLQKPKKRRNTRQILSHEEREKLFGDVCNISLQFLSEDRIPWKRISQIYNKDKVEHKQYKSTQLSNILSTYSNLIVENMRKARALSRLYQ
jgi:Myb-like DNA-binding domain